MKTLKTFIAIPSMETVPMAFCMSLAKLRRAGNTIIGNIQGSLVYSARNDLARKAIELEADQVLWLDSDMTFHPDLLERMTQISEKNNIDFLTAVCYRRKWPYSPCLFDRLDYDGKKVSFTQIMSTPEDRIKVGGCGMAVCLMKTDVIMSVSAKFQGRMFDPILGMGEDVSFCWRARECGYEIWADPSFEIGHVGSMIVGRGHFEAAQASLGGGKNDAERSESSTESEE